MRRRSPDAVALRVLDRVPEQTVRGAVSALISLVGLLLVGPLLARTLDGYRTVASLVFGGTVPLALALVVVIAGVLVWRSEASRREAVHVAFWWLLGLGATVTMGVAVLLYLHGQGVPTPEWFLFVLGNATPGAVGGLVVGFYDARSIRQAAELDAERARLAAEHERLVLLNRIVRHDIANDLQIISGMSDQLEASVDADGRRYLTRIQQTTEDAIDLIERVRTFVTILDDDVSPERRPISLQRVLTTQVDNVREMYRRATIEVDGEIPDVEVRADELLSTVFHNLLTNAIEHNDAADPYVALRVEEEDGQVRVDIADNGPGIPEALRESVFESDIDRRNDSASGVGLYIVKTLLEQYGGDVRVEDNDPRGTVFVVELQTVAA
jgi:signal transduction histidine kinase